MTISYMPMDYKCIRIQTCSRVMSWPEAHAGADVAAWIGQQMPSASSFDPSLYPSITSHRKPMSSSRVSPIEFFIASTVSRPVTPTFGPEQVCNHFPHHANHTSYFLIRSVDMSHATKFSLILSRQPSIRNLSSTRCTQKASNYFVRCLQ